MTFMLVLMLALVVPFIANEQTHAANGFYVSGNNLKDANGNNFVIRGVNNAHAWFDTQAYDALSTISSKKRTLLESSGRQAVRHRGCSKLSIVANSSAWLLLLNCMMQQALTAQLL